MIIGSFFFRKIRIVENLLDNDNRDIDKEKSSKAKFYYTDIFFCNENVYFDALKWIFENR